MVIPDCTFDYVFPQDGTPEEKLYCAILRTFVEDIRHIKLISEKYKGKPLPNSVRYSELHPYIELHSLVSEINSDWTEALCDHAGVNYKAIRYRLFLLIESELNRKFY